MKIYSVFELSYELYHRIDSIVFSLYPFFSVSSLSFQLWDLVTRTLNPGQIQKEVFKVKYSLELKLECAWKHGDAEGINPGNITFFLKNYRKAILRSGP